MHKKIWSQSTNHMQETHDKLSRFGKKTKGDQKK